MAYWGRWQVGHDDDAQRDNAFLLRQRLPLPVSSRSLPSSPPLHAFSIPSIRIEEEGRTEEGGGTAQATKGVTRRRPFN